MVRLGWKCCNRVQFVAQRCSACPLRKSRGRYGHWNPMTRSTSFGRCWKSSMGRPIPTSSKRGLPGTHKAGFWVTVAAGCPCETIDRLYGLNGTPVLRDYLDGRPARRFAGTTLRCLVTGFGMLAASNNCRNPCANSSTAFPKAPSCPTRTIATDRCRSNDGGRKTFTGSIE
jgi:hypothetical protein